MKTKTDNKARKAFGLPPIKEEETNTPGTLRVSGGRGINGNLRQLSKEEGKPSSGKGL